MLCKTVLVAAALASPVFAADAITASGMLTPLEEVQVGSELRGLIVWMAEEGAYVKKGEPLVKLRDNLERLDVELRKAQLDSARYAVERYKKDYEAYKKLHQEKIANDEQLREKELNYLVSKAQVEQYEANLKSAIETVDMKVIRAPTNCVVTRHFKKPGEVLVITAGVENILKVVHLDSIYMVAFPDAKYAHQVKVGQKAQVNIPLYGDRKLSGEVVFVDPVVDAASGGFRIKVLIPNEKHDIKAGLHGTVTLTPETSHAASK
jgi:RND family efflux transporter MFP subunit